MRQIFAVLLLTTLALPSVYGQASSATPPRRVPPKSTPPAEKAEKPAGSRSLLQRIFGARATPTPAPTPAPVVKRVAKPRVKKTTPPADIPAEVALKVTKVAPVTPAKPKTGKGSVTKAPANPDTAALDDASKFKAAKARALEDAQIKDLKSKADGEVNEADAHKALLNYNRALFQKIREIDPSVGAYAGKVEQSMTKRLGAEKAPE